MDVLLCDNEGKNVIDYVFCCMWSVNLEVVKLIMLVLKIVICDVFCIIVVLNIGKDMLKILVDFELLELFLLNEGWKCWMFVFIIKKKIFMEILIIYSLVKFCKKFKNNFVYIILVIMIN